ncbi:hypothetical protein P9222_29375 [Paenibacillus amylolyticus]|nr:hypothetical protein [Paenibacillus amylolyticus]WFR62288.1 hypothetical protein P9222_29375 [Paenibacillus amylolyticus]
MRRSTKFWLTGIAVVTVAVFIIYNNLNPSVTAQDVNLKGTIRQTAAEEYEVQLTIIRRNEDKGQHTIYPVVPGWGSITFSDKGTTDLFNLLRLAARVQQKRSFVKR